MTDGALKTAALAVTVCGMLTGGVLFVGTTKSEASEARRLAESHSPKIEAHDAGLSTLKANYEHINKRLDKWEAHAEAHEKRELEMAQKVLERLEALQPRRRNAR